MRALVEEIPTPCSPEALAESLRGAPGLILLRSTQPDPDHGRYSFLSANPFLTLRSHGPRCELQSAAGTRVQLGNPWTLLAELLARYASPDDTALHFPLGGCFGCWGYDLKNWTEPPRRPLRAANDLHLPDCWLGFYASLVAFDHLLGKAWIVATGWHEDGSRSEARAGEGLEFWKTRIEETLAPARALSESERENSEPRSEPSMAASQHDTRRQCLPLHRSGGEGRGEGTIGSTFIRADFIAAVERAQRYIRAGDIYQVNLSQRLSVEADFTAWELFRRLSEVSPAPYAAFLDAGHFQLASSSPESFLRLSGRHVRTRPIKGTRPRGEDPTRDAQLAYELQTSPKENAELVMITDLLRNDLGRVCEFGSVQVPDLLRLERFAHVQHLVSTVEGRLRPDLTHLDALAACFPGGSITGAPKIRAMEIIDELEPVTRGPYTGALGYLGFNRESQFSLLIRTAVCAAGRTYFHIGAGIVADSDPAAEYEETLIKARGFLAAISTLPTAPPKLRTSPSLP
jgi:para-aminobenzoate synthetase component 1